MRRAMPLWVAVIVVLAVWFIIALVLAIGAGKAMHLADREQQEEDDDL